MAIRLYEFLIGLVTDPARREQFDSARGSLLDQAKLLAEQRQALESEDPERIWQELKEELCAGSIVPAEPDVHRERGSLIVVGTGLQLGAHVTREAEARIKHADKVLHGVGDPGQEAWIRELNPTAESLDRFYELGAVRRSIYMAMTEEVLSWVRRGLNVCAVFYGHPSIFVFASGESIRRARLEGFEARMLPAVSAEDCLFADLVLDSSRGWQSYEATRFLLYQPPFDASTPLILWQAGATGNIFCSDAANVAGLGTLASYLQRFYPADHEVIVYEAAQYPVVQPVVETARLRHLAAAPVTLLTTLYVPPVRAPRCDSEMLSALGLSSSDARLAGLLVEEAGASSLTSSPSGSGAR
jgi:hypothetical protein